MLVLWNQEILRLYGNIHILAGSNQLCTKTAREKVWTSVWYHYLFTAVSFTLWRLTLSYSHKQIPQLRIYTKFVIIACWDLSKAQHCNNDNGSQVRIILYSLETKDKQKSVLMLLWKQVLNISEVELFLTCTIITCRLCLSVCVFS